MLATPLIGQSAAHRQLLEKLSKIATTNVEVLISGPTGVGKELYARFLHQSSSRRAGAFVPVNCGALPNELLENELFGHVGGAFPGARPQSDGLVVEAEHGTLFFDEVDSLTLPNQVKLLRFIQEKEYRRLGETRIRQANVRFVFATNTDLTAAVREGRFREDLLFRLRVFPVEVLPLCERPEDIPLLISEYIVRYSEKYQLPATTLSPAMQRWLESYDWPGNVRELENCVRYLTCLQLGRPAELDDLPFLNIKQDQHQPVAEAAPALADSSEQPFQVAKRDLVSRFEREYLEDALRQSQGNIARAAQASGKARRAFFELMRKHELKATDYLPQSSLSAEHNGNGFNRSGEH